jgi:RNA-binding protein
VSGAVPSLRGKQRRFLRGLGVALSPVVFVGKEGVTDDLLAETDAVLKRRELVKVRLLETVPGPRREVAQELASRAGAELVQVLGRTALLWRRNREKPGIELPA